MGFLSDAQYQALVTACGDAKDAPFLRALVETAAQLANRRSELLGLRVRD